MTTPATPEAPTPAAATPAPDIAPSAPAPVDGLSTARLVAIYGLVALGAVALVLLRAQRRRAGEGHPVAGAPAAYSIHDVDLADVAELASLPPAVQHVLQRYSDAMQQSLGLCSDAVTRLDQDVAALRMEVARVTAGRPLDDPNGTLPVPAPATVSLRDGDPRNGVDGGELAAVPAVPADAGD